MKVIPAIPVQFPDGTTGLQPASAIPVDSILTAFDGSTYTVYEPGDTLPVQEQS